MHAIYLNSEFHAAEDFAIAQLVVDITTMRKAIEYTIVGEGRNKKEAEQNAAASAIQTLGV